MNSCKVNNIDDFITKIINICDESSQLDINEGSNYIQDQILELIKSAKNSNESDLQLKLLKDALNIFYDSEGDDYGEYFNDMTDKSQIFLLFDTKYDTTLANNTVSSTFEETVKAKKQLRQKNFIGSKFKGAPNAKLYFQRSVDNDLVETFLVKRNSTTPKYFTSQEEMNLNVLEYKQELLDRIFSYFENNQMHKNKVSGKPKKMFKNGKYTGVLEELKPIFDAWLSPENLAQSHGKSLDKYYQEYRDNTDSKKELSQQAKRFLDAYNAWIMLQNFDTIIQDVFSQIITVNNFDFNGHVTNLTKYEIRGRASNMWNNWTTSDDIADMSEVISDVTQKLIETSKMYKWGSNEAYPDRYVSFHDFNYVIGLIKNIAFDYRNDNIILNQGLENVSIYTKKILADILAWNRANDNFQRNAEGQSNGIVKPVTLKQLVARINENPQRYFHAIFDILCNTDILKHDNFKDLKIYDKNLIWSFYKEMFGGDGNSRSLYNLHTLTQSDNVYQIITQVAASTFPEKFLQYYEKLDGSISTRLLEDYAQESIENTIFQNIQQTGNALTNEQYKKYNITHTPRRNSNYLDKVNISIPIDEKLKFTIDITSDIVTIPQYTIDEYNKIWNNQQVQNFFKDILGIDFGNDPDFKNAYIEIVQTTDKAIKDLSDIIGTMIFNSVVNNQFVPKHPEALVNEAGLKTFINNQYGTTKGTDYAKNINLATGMISVLPASKKKVLLTNLTLAKCINNNLLSQAQSKTGEGTSLANYTLSRMRNFYQNQLEMQCKSKRSAVKNLSFVVNSNGLFEGILSRRELKTLSTNQQSTKFSDKQSFQLSFISDFISGFIPNPDGGYIKNGRVSFLPTVNSDKSQIDGLLVNLYAETRIPNGKGGYKKYIELTDEEIEQEMISEFKNMYNNIVFNINSELNKVKTAIDYYNRKLIQEGKTPLYINPQQDVLTNYFNILATNKKNKENNLPTLTVPLFEANQALLNIINDAFKDNENFGKKSKERITNGLHEILTEYNKTHSRNPIMLSSQVHYIFDDNGLLTCNKTLKAMWGRFGQDMTPQVKQEIIDLYKNEPDYLNYLQRNGLTDPTNVHSFFKYKEQLTVENLIKMNFSIPLRGSSDIVRNNSQEIQFLRGETQFTEQQLSDPNYAHLIQLNNEMKNWIGKDGMMILAKGIVNGEYINIKTVEQLHNATNLKIHPMLSKLNRLDYLCSQQYTISTVGSHYVHKGSAKEGQILVEEAKRWLASNKRNVAETSTVHLFQNKQLDGVPSTYNVAIIEDVYFDLYNIMGDLYLEGHAPLDGGMFVNGYMTYLENNSLAGESAGLDKKQFGTFYSELYGAGGIVKTAGFAATNDRMRREKAWYNLQKNMTNRKWIQEYPGPDGADIPAVIDITYSDYLQQQIDYTKAIKGQKIMYKRPAHDNSQELAAYRLERIESLGNNKYRIHEVEINQYGNEVDGEIHTRDVIIDSSWSLYENVFGGHLSLEIGHDNKLTWSENSMKLLAYATQVIAFRKNNSHITDEKIKNYFKNLKNGLDQDDVWQPLKAADIHYTPNIGAIKSLQFNVNPDGEAVLNSETTLNFMTMRLAQLGIQLDKEHHADLSNVSMPSQIIQACANKSYTSEYAKEIYDALSVLTRQVTQPFLDGIKDIITGEDPTKLVEEVTNLILDNLLHQSSEDNSTNAILKELLDKAEKGDVLTFAKDIKGKIPWSDPTINAKLFSSLSTTLTNLAVKMKFAGILSVICPTGKVEVIYGDRMMNSFIQIFDKSGSTRTKASGILLEEYQKSVREGNEVDSDGRNMLIFDLNRDLDNQPIKNIPNFEQLKNVKLTYKEILEELGNDEIAKSEIKDTIAIAKKGMSFDDVLSTVNPIFTPKEIQQIKTALNGKNLQVKSVSRQTDPAFFAKEIINFLEENSKKPFTDPTRVNAIELWSKHDGTPIQDILKACKKYKVAPMVSFSITTLGNTALEKGVLKYTDLIPLIGALIKNGDLDPRTTTIRIDPILVGVTNMNDIRNVVSSCKALGIKKFVTSLVQSYGYTEGTPRDRKVISGINEALATEGKSYNWDLYYGRDNQGKINFKPKQEYINQIGSVLLDIAKDPEIKLETCAFIIPGLKASACLDPMIIERITGIDVTKSDGTYDRDTSRKDCMCYGCHGDIFKGIRKECYSSCAYCYAAHSGDSNLEYYNEDGTIINRPLTQLNFNYESADAQQLLLQRKIKKRNQRYKLSKIAEVKTQHHYIIEFADGSKEEITINIPDAYYYLKDLVLFGKKPISSQILADKPVIYEELLNKYLNDPGLRAQVESTETPEGVIYLALKNNKLKRASVKKETGYSNEDLNKWLPLYNNETGISLKKLSEIIYEDHPKMFEDDQDVFNKLLDIFQSHETSKGMGLSAYEESLIYKQAKEQADYEFNAYVGYIYDKYKMSYEEYENLYNQNQQVSIPVIKVYENVEKGRELGAYNVRFSNNNIDDDFGINDEQRFQIFDLDSVNLMFNLNRLNIDKKIKGYKLFQELTPEEQQQVLNKIFNSTAFDKDRIQNRMISAYPSLPQFNENFINNILNSDYKDKLLDIIKLLHINTKPRAYRKMQNDLFRLSDNYKGDDRQIYVNGELINPVNIQIDAYELIMPQIYKTQFGLQEYDDLQEILRDKEFFLKRGLSRFECKLQHTDYDYELKNFNGEHYYILDKNKGIPEHLKSKISTHFYETRKGKTYRTDYNRQVLYELSSEDDSICTIGGVDIIITDNPLFYVQNLNYNTLKTSPLRVTEESYQKLIDTLSQSKRQNSINFLNAIKNPDGNYFDLNTFKEFNQQIDELNYENVKLQSATSQTFKTITQLCRILIQNGKELHTSFSESLNIVAGRIPAQSQQSFMTQRVIGFDNSGLNTAMVSTFQLFLQGSDLDIDAVTLLGYEFDKNGKFVKWSPYFKCDSKENLIESKNIPLPTGKISEINASENAPDNFFERYNKYFGTLFTLIPLTNGGYRTDRNGNYELALNANTPEGLKLLAEFLREFNEYGINIKAPVIKDLIRVPNDKFFNLPPINIDGKEIERLSNLQEKLQVPPSQFYSIAKQLLKFANDHNNYINIVDEYLKDKMAKNYIVHYIYKVSGAPCNQTEAMIGLDQTTKTVKDEADNSFMATAANSYAPGGAETKHKSVGEGQVGKSCVGIGAVGIKANSTTQFYISQLWNFGTKKDKEKILFKRPVVIAGKTYESFANMYTTAEFNEEERTYFAKALNILENLESPDQITENVAVNIASLLSIAVDNAKDLALAKINSGPRMMGMYVYGLTLGIPIQTLVEIINSEEGRIITELTEGSYFSNDSSSFKVLDVFDKLKGNIGRDLTKYEYVAKNADDKSIKILTDLRFGNKQFYIRNSNDMLFAAMYPEYQNWYNQYKNYLPKTKKGQTPKLATTFSQMVSQIISINLNSEYNIFITEDPNKRDIFNLIYDRSKNRLNEYVKKLSGISNDSYLNYIASIYQLKDYISNINEKSRIFYNPTRHGADLQVLAEGAEEMRILGSILSINKGLKSSMSETEIFIDTIENLIYNRKEILGQPPLEKDRIDFIKFMLDEEYQNQKIEEYEKVKHSVNILHLISKVTHFNEYLKASVIPPAFFLSSSIKYRTLHKYRHNINADTDSKDVISLFKLFETENSSEKEQILKGLENLIQNRLMMNWLASKQYKFKIPKGFKYFNKDKSLDFDLNEELSIDLSTEEGLATFKKYMEEEIIPNLINNPLYSNNAFVRNLTKIEYNKTANHDTVYIYSLHGDLMSKKGKQAELNAEMFAAFQNLSSIAFQPESGIPSLSDAFYLYALYCYNGKKGQRSLMNLFDIETSRSNLAKSFNEYVAIMDSEGNMKFNEEELITWCAPKITQYSKAKYGYTFGRNTFGISLRQRIDKNIVLTDEQIDQMAQAQNEGDDGEGKPMTIIENYGLYRTQYSITQYDRIARNNFLVPIPVSVSTEMIQMPINIFDSKVELRVGLTQDKITHIRFSKELDALLNEKISNKIITKFNSSEEIRQYLIDELKSVHIPYKTSLNTDSKQEMNLKILQTMIEQLINC